MKKSTKIIIAAILVVAATIFGGYVYLDDYVARDTFYTGISIDKVQMGGYTLQEGIQALKESKKSVLSRDIALQIDGSPELEYSLNMSDLALDFNYEEIAKKAYEVGRSGNIFQRYQSIRDLENNPLSLELTPEIKVGGIEKILDDIAKDVEVEAVDAQFSFQTGQFEIVKPVTGKRLDRESFMASLVQLGEDVLFKDSLVIPVKVIEPEISEEYYERINGLIGEFSTSFAGSSAGRAHNIRLSAESFKGMLVMPGQEVSYNKTTGPRQAQFGYREAPVIENGELIPGMGGGVCQTSTTLYNALLLADMKIIERSPHSIPPAYVPRGTDAAVATGYLDLRFRNDFDYPVMIDSKTEGTRVFFYVYGDRDNRDYSVKITTSNLASIPYKVHENVDNSLPSGAKELVQAGRNGYKVNTFKSIVKNGETISTKQISYDYYRERDYIYKVGPSAPPVTEVPTPVTEVPPTDTQEPEQPQVENPPVTPESNNLEGNGSPTEDQPSGQ